MKLSFINKLLNLLPTNKYLCKSCYRQFEMKKGKARYAKLKFNGPYCPKCGQSVNKRS